MKRWALILPVLLVCGAASSPPPLPGRYRPAQGVTQGAGALAIRSKARPAALAGAPVPQINQVIWTYGVNTSDYWWNLESSPDLQTWSVLVSNVIDIVTLTNNRTEPKRFYRMAGRSEF